MAPMLDCERAGWEASRKSGFWDNQTVEAPSTATRNRDANKQIVGRKRHIAVDTDWRLLMVNHFRQRGCTDDPRQNLQALVMA